MVIINVDAEKDDNIPHHARGVAFMSGGGSISARGSISKSGEGANVKWGGEGALPRGWWAGTLEYEGIRF